MCVECCMFDPNIATELLPTHSRATGLGLMLSTRLVQGLFEIFVPPAVESNLPVLSVVYSVVYVAIYVSKQIRPVLPSNIA